MTISQQTISQVDITRNAELNVSTETVVTVQDTIPIAQRDQLPEKIGTIEPAVEIIASPVRRQFTYPAWPTSQPGPQVTSPLPGQIPHPMRTDQMLYACYDQEHGRPCVSKPTQCVPVSRTRTYFPDTDLQEATTEAKAMERWLDDGGNMHGHYSNKGGN